MALLVVKAAVLLHYQLVNHTLFGTVMAAKTPRLKPIAKQSAEHQATDYLRSCIISGAIKPGARITEIDLAEQLGIARGTLRTGLNRLAAEGIVVQTPYVGWQVAELSSKDIWEIWTLRGSLESLAASLAAKSTDPKVKKAIHEAYENLSKACSNGSRKRIDECDFELHRLIVESANNSRLSKHYQLVQQQIRWVIASTNIELHENTDTILQQHHDLVVAILDGNPEEASRCAWRHTEYDGDRLVEWAEGREKIESLA
ncbi:GntR family transcriptional regulator [Pseudomonas putida]|uniref:GntR family transcriptional regulator n=1 Tax=Pseudomonas putida TaxID=303 RepID=UPI00300EF3A9